MASFAGAMLPTSLQNTALLKPFKSFKIFWVSLPLRSDLWLKFKFLFQFSSQRALEVIDWMIAMQSFEFIKVQYFFIKVDYNSVGCTNPVCGLPQKLYKNINIKIQN